MNFTCLAWGDILPYANITLVLKDKEYRILKAITSECSSVHLFRATGCMFIEFHYAFHISESHNDATFCVKLMIPTITSVTICYALVQKNTD
jgi:hypothetical protein